MNILARRSNWVIATLLIFASAHAARGVTVDGVVRDREGNPLPNTRVEAYSRVDSQLALVSETVSTATGRYRVEAPPGIVISAVYYDNPAWQPRVVKNISGREGDDHIINKVLLDKQGPMQFLPILEQVHEYEELYYLERELHPDMPQAQFKRRMAKRFAERIRAMPDPRRAELQPEKQQGIIEKMTGEQRQVLADKMQGLFDLYALEEIPDIGFSRWNTSYTTEAGQQVQAVVQLQGDSGRYDLVQDGRYVDRGRLSDIEVRADGAAFAIRGRWTLGDISGWFSWKSSADNPDAFSGHWGYRAGEPEGRWFGQQLPDAP